VYHGDPSVYEAGTFGCENYQQARRDTAKIICKLCGRIRCFQGSTIVCVGQGTGHLPEFMCFVRTKLSYNVSGLCWLPAILESNARILKP